MKKIYFLAFFALVEHALFSQTPPAFSPTAPSDVLVVYRSDDYLDFNKNGISDSKELAEYYQSKRNIPTSNLLGITMTESNYWVGFGQDKVGWKNFLKELVYPIQKRLMALGGDTSIKYIVLCGYGIPHGLDVTNLGITTAQNARSIDGMLVAMNDIGDTITPKFSNYWETNPYYESSPTRPNDNGSFFHSKYKLSNGKPMYLVSRFIGPDFQMWRNQIDMALYGEKYIYIGKGYYNGVGYSDSNSAFDSTVWAGYPYYPYSYAQFDKNAACIHKHYEAAGIPYMHEDKGSVIGQKDTANKVIATWSDGSVADSARRAMVYGGWYNYGRYVDVFDWIPGAFGCDLNSCSAYQIPIGSPCWLANAFRKGLTCGTGVIAEPYLSGQSQPNDVIYYLLNGYDFMSAAYLGQPDIKWMGLVIGDPLYNPFSKSKVPAIDNSIQPSTVTYDFESDSSTTVFLDYNVTLANPEVVKAKLQWGTSGVYNRIKKSDSLFYAHHIFKFKGLSKDSVYHFQICVFDPVGNTWCSVDHIFSTNGNFSTGIKTGNDDNLFTVFPNPSDGNFNLSYEVNANSIVQVDVLNMLGEIVYKEVNKSNRGNYSSKLNLQSLAKGAYVMRLSTSTSVVNKRIEIL